MIQSLFTSKNLAGGGEMAGILLTEFLGRAEREGVNLKGCIVNCSQRIYKFTGLDELGRVEILYGDKMDHASRLTEYLRIHDVQLERRTTRNSLVTPISIVLNCVNPHRR